MNYVALLRGIAPANPNMRNDKLRRVFEKLGFANVQTVISSGNVLFESSSPNIKELEETIEKAFQKSSDSQVPRLFAAKRDYNSLKTKIPFREWSTLKSPA